MNFKNNSKIQMITSTLNKYVKVKSFIKKKLEKKLLSKLLKIVINHQIFLTLKGFFHFNNIGGSFKKTLIFHFFSLSSTYI